LDAGPPGRRLVVLGQQSLRPGLGEDQPGDPVGTAGGEQGDRPAGAGRSDQCHLCDTGVVEDREDIVGLLLEDRDVIDGIGQPEAAPLEEQRPRESGAAFEVVMQMRIGPHQVRVHHDLEEPGHRVGSAAHQLVRQCVAVALDVPRHGRVHGTTIGGDRAGCEGSARE